MTQTKNCQNNLKDLQECHWCLLHQILSPPAGDHRKHHPTAKAVCYTDTWWSKIKQIRNER
uniref:Uncharacterized protein n=1 Tax=Anguilla anguilla TaxID=7936 RepID=A0A0E9XNV1_ANGAN